MTTLNPGEEFRSPSPLLTVDNPLGPGDWRLRLVVVDDDGNLSDPQELTVSVIRRIRPPPPPPRPDHTTIPDTVTLDPHLVVTPVPRPTPIDPHIFTTITPRPSPIDPRVVLATPGPGLGRTGFDPRVVIRRPV